MNNADQEEFWTDRAGPVWVAQMDAMDATLAPVLDAVLTRAALQPGERVLDIGCGAGTSTIIAAKAVGAGGHVLGLDISRTLLDTAQTRAQNLPQVDFGLADAQTHGFAEGDFDVLISRFGVMFFEDPTAAFANMARALRAQGRVIFATWGPIPDNPFFTMPAAVAKGVLPPIPRSDPDAPGPFSMRDAALLRRIMADAGLVDIRVEAVPVVLSPEGDARDVAALMCEIGPAQAALAHHDADASTRDRMIDALEEGLEAFVTSDGLRIPALLNLGMARKAA